MDFNLDKQQTFDRALKPNEIMTETKNWNTIEGYVYIISRKMLVTSLGEGDKPLNCVKVGFSNITTRERFEKGYARLLSFRTSLIELTVHRIYLFERNDFDAGKKEAFGLSAYQAEQTLHKLIDMKFKPPQVHINFSNGEKSEWWNIKEKHMEKFLDFCDKKIQLDTPLPPIYGTAFSKNSAKQIIFPKRLKITGIQVNEENVPEKKKEYRNTNNKYARDLRNRRTTQAIVNQKKEEKEMTGKKKRDLEKTVPFWRDLLVGKKFTDKKMHPDDKGFYKGKKIIVNIFKETRQQILVEYDPDISDKQKERAKQESIDNSSGVLTINETLLYFPDLQKKYLDSYEYYAKKNKFEDDYDYTEKFI